MKRYGIILLVIGLIAVLSMALVFAQEAKKAKVDPMTEKQELAKAIKVSMADALATASKQVSGTVLNGEVENENGKTIYSFEILPTPDSKIIKEVNIDAATGAIIATEDEGNATEAKEKAAESKEGKQSEEKMAKSEKGEKDEAGEEGEKDAKGEKEKKEGKWKALKIKVAIDKLPAAVTAAVKKEAAGAKITSATTMPKIYSVEVTKGEESSEILVTSSGKIIEKEAMGNDEKGEKDEQGEKDEKNEKD